MLYICGKNYNKYGLDQRSQHIINLGDISMHVKGREIKPLKINESFHITYKSSFIGYYGITEEVKKFALANQNKNLLLIIADHISNADLIALKNEKNIILHDKNLYVVSDDLIVDGNNKKTYTFGDTNFSIIEKVQPKELPKPEGIDVSDNSPE
tara:strand:- start:65 stop:526 length:462 start_codon:yes stop_codon:yes gene_type:complete